MPKVQLLAQLIPARCARPCAGRLYWTADRPDSHDNGLGRCPGLGERLAGPVSVVHLGEGDRADLLRQESVPTDRGWGGKRIRVTGGGGCIGGELYGFAVFGGWRGAGGATAAGAVVSVDV